jgi:hypothetical protein
VLRKVQRTGYVDTWTDVRRASSSFLGQAGAIDGSTTKQGVDRATAVRHDSSCGTVAAQAGSARQSGEPGREPAVRLQTSRSAPRSRFQPGESDASQVTITAVALFYRKRPFFLEGSSVSTPTSWLHCRLPSDRGRQVGCSVA